MTTERKTQNILTKHEMAKIIGLRASQLSNDAPPLTDIDGITDCLEIAKKEFYEKKLPFIVRRHLPNGTYEDWPLKELDFIESYYDNE